MKEGKDKRKGSSLQGSFITGAIALVFLIIGYEVALFVHKAAVLRIQANRDRPDTVYVIDRALALEILRDAGTFPGAGPFPETGTSPEAVDSSDASALFIASEDSAASGPGQSLGNLASGDLASEMPPGAKKKADAPGGISEAKTKKKADAPGDISEAKTKKKADTPGGISEAKTKKKADAVVVRKNATHSATVRQVREKALPRQVESFRFNPNTVSLEDLQRLGFSEKQALSIVHYREKGGRFRRKADFAKSYVVADSVYARLAPFIDIPKIDINRADSTALVALPGIGPWFAARIVSYREELGGYSRPEQLMEIYHFDREKFDGLADLISCSRPDPYPLWTLPEEELARHPYISKAEAHGVVLYRMHQPREAWTVEGLKKAGVLSEEHAAKLAHCRIE